MSRPGNTEIEQFFDAQATYARVIKENYMRHADIIRWIRDRMGGQHHADLRVLETGCGDAYVISQLAEELGVQAYTGIDLARNSLQAARANLRAVVPELKLVQGDIMEEIADLNGKYELIIAGYVLHHFQRAEKEEVFSLIRKLLAEDGAFLLYDVTSGDDEPREAYLNRAMDLFDRTWTALTKEQLSEIRRHVFSHDHPESLRSWQELAKANGLRCVAGQPLADHGLFGAMHFVAHSEGL
jgi:cyclopropane fatty-acyl-phospholipid synthase-like methyltransferase